MILPDKPLVKSLTVLGVVVVALAELAAEAGLLPPLVKVVVQALGFVATVVGVRRAIGAVKAALSEYVPGDENPKPPEDPPKAPATASAVAVALEEVAK